MKITELYIYPIKSLHPLSVPRTRLRREGLEHDRRFMLLKVLSDDQNSYKPIQTALFPECTLFHQAIDGGDIVVTYHTPAEPLFPPVPEQRTALRVPLAPDVGVSGMETVDVELMGSATTAYRMGGRYDEWFSACMGYETILVYIGDQGRGVLAHTPSGNAGPRPKQQQQQQKSWFSSITSYITGSGDGPGRDGKGHRKDNWLTFNECAPFLLTSQASLRDVSARLPEGEAMDMIKFRPNIVVDSSPTPSSSTSPPATSSENSSEAGGSQDSQKQRPEEAEELKPWDEDFWAEVTVLSAAGTSQSNDKHASPQPHRLALTANCARCISINIDYGTGRPALGEQGSVLKKLMRDRRVDAGNKWSPIFGRYAFLLPPSSPRGGAGDHEGTGGGDDEDGGEYGDDELAVDIAVGDEVTVTRRIADRDVWAWPKV
ncbi:Uu.00g016730.m01.CDS01 [Anthostomella pinea]|uniref:Uu.00g016730.m01.CDS01 n=1 Tax=Anthostomella pinea TaxID=933095 RepID=A0AAI8VYR5_9PEZI|nr:Uu.00g016730.m01.CDS01 [Anthostomella pinea]